MSYSQSILGKELNEITFLDLVTYFQNPRQESNIAEYKSFNPNGDFEQKFGGIYQAVCALLNSEGGLLIWGAPVGQRIAGKKEKEFSGDLTPLDRILEKDYLVNKLSDNIIPLPNNLKVEIIEHEGNCVVLVEVEKSSYAPHQTNNTYFMRLDGQSKPAPHHYIEALFKQIKYPDLGGYIKFENIVTDGQNYYFKIKVVVVNHSALLNEENVSFRFTCDNGLINNAYNGSNPIVTLGGHQLYYDNFQNILHYGAVPFFDITLIFNPHELVNNNYECQLILMFGGKKSPMKRSDYKLRINNIYPENINDLVYEIKENRLMYEAGIGKGTELEKINIFLER
nr:ATP-binding protein [uncultured Draconibacterium sp.]